MPNLVTSVEGEVLVASINRSRAKNAIDAKTADELYKIFSDFEQNDNLKVAVLI